MVTRRHGMLGLSGGGVSLKRVPDGWGMGSRQSYSDCRDCTVPAVWLWLQGRGELVERSESRRPPWEEETDKATSLGPQESQAPGLEQLN